MVTGWANRLHLSGHKVGKVAAYPLWEPRHSPWGNSGWPCSYGKAKNLGKALSARGLSLSSNHIFTFCFLLTTLIFARPTRRLARHCTCACYLRPKTVTHSDTVDYSTAWNKIEIKSGCTEKLTFHATDGNSHKT